MLFGAGLVKSVENFGSQGDWPAHPELLDWLAVEFMENGWDVKGILKMILMSATYRQSSQVSPDLHQRDPENRRDAARDEVVMNDATIEPDLDPIITSK